LENKGDEEKETCKETISFCNIGRMGVVFFAGIKLEVKWLPRRKVLG
jgi:hypothetical protein